MEIKLCECGCGQPIPIPKPRKCGSCGHPLPALKPKRFLFNHANVLKHKEAVERAAQRAAQLASNPKPVRHGMSGTVEYAAFHDARIRCDDPRDPSWKNYGGRGIQFRFSTFEQFITCLGRRPAGMTLDRIDNDGHYEQGNVRWATRSLQTKNRRRFVGP